MKSATVNRARWNEGKLSALDELFSRPKRLNDWPVINEETGGQIAVSMMVLMIVNCYYLFWWCAEHPHTLFLPKDIISTASQIGPSLLCSGRGTSSSCWSAWSWEHLSRLRRSHFGSNRVARVVKFVSLLWMARRSRTMSQKIEWRKEIDWVKEEEKVWGTFTFPFTLHRGIYYSEQTTDTEFKWSKLLMESRYLYTVS